MPNDELVTPESLRAFVQRRRDGAFKVPDTPGLHGSEARMLRNILSDTFATLDRAAEALEIAEGSIILGELALRRARALEGNLRIELASVYQALRETHARVRAAGEDPRLLTRR